MAKKPYRPKPGLKYETSSQSAAAELKAAIAERRFRPWHAATLLDMAKTGEDFGRAVEMITTLVGRGQRREVTREEM